MTNKSSLRRLAAAALTLAIGVVALVGPLDRPAAAATSVPTTAGDNGFLSLLNTLRGTLGLPVLALDPRLSAVAQAWSVKMAERGVMSHNPDLVDQVPAWAKLAENVGFGDGGVTQIFNALVASPPHLRNMSDPAFTLVGVGTVLDANGRMWTTHVFLLPATGTATARATTPTTTQAVAPSTTRAPVRTTATTLARPVAPATLPPARTAPPAPVTTPAPPTATGPTATVPITTGTTVPATPVQTAEGPVPALAPVHPVSSHRQPGTAAPLAAVASLIILLVLLDVGWLLRRPAGEYRRAR